MQMDARKFDMAVQLTKIALMLVTMAVGFWLIFNGGLPCRIVG